MGQSEIEKPDKVLIDLVRKHNFRIDKIVDDQKGPRLFITSASGSNHECIIRFLNLDRAGSIKILKSVFDYEIQENNWIILGLIMDQMHPVFYMIPLTVFKTPNNWFIDNEQPHRLNHMSNWEIKIYLKAVPHISRYLL